MKPTNSCQQLLIALLALAVTCSAASAQVLPRNKAVANPVTPVPGPVPAVTVAPQPAPVVTVAPQPAPVVASAPQPVVTVSQPGVTVTPPVATVVAGPVAQNIQMTRAADLGLWFSGMANNGLTIADLADTSIFTNAGFRVSDQIVSINGQPIRTEAQFVQYLTDPTLGTQPVQILIVRNGQQHALTLSPAAITQGVVNHDPLYRYGLVIDDTNPSHIVVQRVYPRTPAYYAGLRQGDVITTFGGQRVTSLQAFTQGLNQANVAIPLQITRSGQTRDIQLDTFGTVDSSVRTALRPNIDVNAGSAAAIETRVTPAPLPAPGSAVIRTPDSTLAPARLPDSTLAPARLPDSGLPVSPPVTIPPAPIPTPAIPATPTVVTPAVPATPAVVPAPVPR